MATASGGWDEENPEHPRGGQESTPQPWSYDNINSWYNKYLGHGVGDQSGGWSTWAGDPNAESNIKNSGEGQAYAQRQSQTPTATAPGQAAPPSTYNRDALNQAIQQLQFSQGSDMGQRHGVQYNPADFIKQHQGDFAAGVKMVGSDKIQLPDGEIVDIAANVGDNGMGGAWWGSAKDWNAGLGNPNSPNYGGSVGGGGGGSASASSSSGNGLNPNASGQYQSLIDTLMGRAKQSLNIDPSTDSIIRPQVDNAAAQAERQRRAYLNNMAESSNPYATGAQNTAATQTAEGNAQGSANLQSQLVSQELTSRRSEIQNALSEMGSLLSGDQQRSLQMELAQIDAGLRQQQINSGNDQFMANLGLQAENQANYWDQLRRQY